MKKVLFSAIALVAFTATSMATEVVKKKKNDTKSKTVVTSDKCIKIYDQVYAFMRGLGASEGFAVNQEIAAFDDCVSPKTKSVYAG